MFLVVVRLPVAFLAVYFIPWDGADIVMFQAAFGDSVNTHSQTAGRVRAHATAIGFYPVGRMALALFGR